MCISLFLSSPLPRPGSIDFELMAEQLEQLRAGLVVEVPTYDFVRHCRTGATTRINGRTPAVR